MSLNHHKEGGQGESRCVSSSVISVCSCSESSFSDESIVEGGNKGQECPFSSCIGYFLTVEIINLEFVRCVVPYILSALFRALRGYYAVICRHGDGP